MDEPVLSRAPRRAVPRGAIAAFVAVLVATLVGMGCGVVTPAPVVQKRIYRVPKGSLERVAVIPFYPKETLSKYAGKTETSPSAAAELLARFVTEALMKRGIAVVAPSDLETAFIGQGIAVPRADPRAAAELAAEQFGATAVLLGEVSRWRERGGEKYGASQAASVAFELTVYSAPVPRRVWSSKFDETQRPLTEHILNAPRYPGGGTRWLTAAELAQWGADSAIETLPRR